MGKLRQTAIGALVSTSLLAGMAVGAWPVYAYNHHHHDVTRSGSCSDTSRWRLELDDMMMMDDIEVHYEVWSDTAGQVWKVNLKDNGTVFWRGTRTTNWNGHFMVHTWTHDRSGTDKIVGTSVNQTTDEVCSGVASI